MSFKAQINASVGWAWSDGAVDDGSLAYAERLADGNGDNEAEAAWHVEEQTLLDAESTTLDLSNLTRIVLGDTLTLTFLTLKALLVVNHGSTGQLVLGGAAEDEWSEPFGNDGDLVAVPPDSVLLLANRQAGWTVDDASRNLELTAEGGDVVYSIAIVGTLTVPDSGSGSGT
jgi:hypothetical protein